MANNSMYNLLIEKKNINILKDNFDFTSLKNNEEYKISLNPEYIQGYYGCKNNLLKFAYKKIIYSYNNLIIIYDLLNQNQSIFSEHKNKVIFFRCKENCRTVLSAEDSNNKIKIFIWNKLNLQILTHIKIKKENFLDIDFLNDKNILLLCKHYDKLIFFVFFVIYKKKNVLLKKKYVNVIKKLDDLDLAKKKENLKNNDHIFTNLDKLITKEIKRYKACNIFKKKDEEYIKICMHSILNKIKKKKKKKFGNYEKYKPMYNILKQNKKLKKNLYKKNYFKKLNGEIVSCVKIKKYKKHNIFFYYITFIKPFKKCKKSYNVLLGNFKIFVDINKIICIYNEEYVFIYLLKNYILYEKLKYKNFQCNCYLDDNAFSLIKQNHSFFSIFHFYIFIKKLILNQHICFKKDIFLPHKNHFEDNILKSNQEEKREIDEDDKNKKESGEKYVDGQSELNISSISNNSSHNCLSKNMNDYFNFFINDEINVVEIITFISTKEDNDMDIIFNLQKCAKKKKKKDFERKKYFVIGTKNGVIIIIDFTEPHKIVHLEKICSDNIVSIFIFQNNVLILNCLGILFFMNAYNFKVYKNINIFEKNNKNDLSFLTNSNLQDYDISPNILEKKLNSFRNNKSNKNNSKNNNVIRKKSGDTCKNKENSIIYYKEKKNNHVNIFENCLKKSSLNELENKYIYSSCLLDIYILVIGTSDNEIIIYDLINNEICFICKKNYKINYFILEDDNIIYNIENSLYKMNLINYNSFKLLTLAKINISSFVFYSDSILICGTFKGNLYFFDISNNNVKVINKIERKRFVQKEVFHNSFKSNEKQIIFSIRKVINKKFVRKSNIIEKEVHNDRIIRLVLNKSKTFLLCSLKHMIFLFKLSISGNEKIDLKCVRYFNINNIIHISLLKKFDNLFYIATKENNNCYSYHLCSFNSAKIKKDKLDCIYFNILYENTWICEFFYYNGENFILTENNLDKNKKRCIMLLDSFSFIIYSYKINRTNNFSCNNSNYSIKNKTSNETINKIYDNKNYCLDVQKKNNFTNKIKNSNTLANEKKFDIKKKNIFRKTKKVNSEIHVCLKKIEAMKISSNVRFNKDLTNKLKRKEKEEENKKKREKEKEEEKRKKKLKEIKKTNVDKEKQIEGIKERKNIENNENKIKQINEKKKDQNKKKGGKKTRIYINSHNQPKVKESNIKEIKSSNLSVVENKIYAQDNINNIIVQKKIFKSNHKLNNRLLLKDVLKTYKEDEILMKSKINTHEKKKISYIKYKLLRNILQKKNVELFNHKKLINESNNNEKKKSDEIKEYNYEDHEKKVSYLFLNKKSSEKINFYKTYDKKEKEVLINDQYQKGDESIDKGEIKKNIDESNYILNYLRKYLNTNILKENVLNEKQSNTKNYDNDTSLVKRHLDDYFISNESNVSNITIYKNNNKNNIISKKDIVFYLTKELDKVNNEENENLNKKEVNKISKNCDNNCERINNYKSNNYECNKCVNNDENSINDNKCTYLNCDNKITYIKDNISYKNYLYFNSDNNENNKNNNHNRNYPQYNDTSDNNNHKKSNYIDKKYQNNYYDVNNFGNKNHTNKICHFRYNNEINYGKFVSSKSSYKKNTHLKRNSEINSIFNICNDGINTNTHIKKIYVDNLKYVKYNIMSLDIMKDKRKKNSIGTNHINKYFSILNNNSKNKNLNIFANNSNKDFYKNE
ncbi:conserved Plasmodium protein, unknown function [Plasmodium gallinaceum]|uniref:Uncharacterized protein n=1 Tax=Plasmodium gallinaceum TaxID=5849 RepID=A0A1J1GST7_PLAGA|nr:conserved Plasmodium protein, unknown function [Plasmodium gallinaceum]CRG94368.1 conserved Plasmodium protein, unknown function [Plasmodium gallinaceum]